MRTSSWLLVPLLLASSTEAWAVGGVIVEANERGASIYVDGADTGQDTPATIMGLTDGRHRITVRDGCYMAETVVEIGGMQVIPLTMELVEGSGSIELQPVPPEAQVTIDGEPFTGPIGQTVDVSCGPHTIQASLPGYLSTMVTVEVEAGEPMVLPLELERLGVGSLRIDVNPDTASLRLDGRELGVGDREVHGVVAGPHVLRAILDGAEKEKQFILEDGETLEIGLELLPGDIVPATATATPIADNAINGPKRTVRPIRYVGYGMLGLGAGAGAFAISQWSQGRHAYVEYLDRAAAVNNGEAPESFAADYHEQEVKPFRGPIYGSTAAAALLLGGGVTLSFVF